jgi:hypothetical protein
VILSGPNTVEGVRGHLIGDSGDGDKGEGGGDDVGGASKVRALPDRELRPDHDSGRTRPHSRVRMQSSYDEEVWGARNYVLLPE